MNDLEFSIRKIDMPKDLLNGYYYHFVPKLLQR